MSQPLHDFVESVNAALCALAFEVNAKRQANQANKSPEHPADVLAKPQRPAFRPVSDSDFACDLGDVRLSFEVQKKLEEEAQRTATAIFAAESVFSAACLQALADSEATSASEACSMRAAGDAVLRFAGAALRAYKFFAQTHTSLARLIALAALLPSKAYDEASFHLPAYDRLAPRLAPDLAPRLTSPLG